MTLTALLELTLTPQSLADAPEVLRETLQDTRAFPGCLGVEVLIVERELTDLDDLELEARGRHLGKGTRDHPCVRAGAQASDDHGDITLVWHGDARCEIRTRHAPGDEPLARAPHSSHSL